MLLTSEDMGKPGSLLGRIEDVEYVGACATDKRGRVEARLVAGSRRGRGVRGGLDSCQERGRDWDSCQEAMTWRGRWLGLARPGEGDGLEPDEMHRCD